MVNVTAKLGGTASDITVGKIGHGLMRMTPDEICFESIKAGIDSLPENAKMLLNSGEFYGNNPPTANLELLAIFLSVKGASGIEKYTIDGSPENVRRSVDNVNAVLRGTKKLDLFECARVDPKHPVEDTIQALSELIKEGKFNHIGMSECNAQTIRRANTIHPVALVEIEVSPWSYEKETKEVIQTCKELGISVAAYSPIGHGILSGNFTKPDDLEPDDLRRSLSRLQEENWKHNVALVDALKGIAAKKGCTPAQLSIAWVCSRGDNVIPIPGSARKDRTLENLEAGDISFSQEEIKEIDDILERFEMKGARHRENTPLLWG
ncbi:aldo/keto reductase [Cyathus striatus]|nr:aldo/keto reductase [Cyathus striatus]